MKKQPQYRKIFLLVLLLTKVISITAQQRFAHTTTKANITCNSDCTELDNPELNNNPAAIIFVTPVSDKGSNLNLHPICAYYTGKKWRIYNMNQKAMAEGVTFNVEYVSRPDSTHFQYTISRENLLNDGTSFINHPALNNNPNAQFRFFHSWVPELRGGTANRDEVNILYNTETGKWCVSNINKKPLYARITYNIAVASGDIVNKRDSASSKAVEIRELIIRPTIAETTTPPVAVEGDPIALIKTPKTNVLPADTLLDTNRPIDKNEIVTKNPTTPSYDFSKVRICIEEITNKSLPPKTPIPTAPVIPKIKSNGELEPVTTVIQPLSIATNLMWTQGESISVGFLPGETISVINKIKTYAKEWETYANIKFVFTNNVSQAMIKVGFKKDNTSWSWMGRDVLVNQFEGKTMNLGWVNDNLSESEFRRVVLHEFGHALGFIHEHQSPNAGIPWDSAKVYSFYGGSPNYWNKEKVDFNIFQKYWVTSVNSSTYDKLSIMHYSFPAQLTKDSSSVPENTNLSSVDKSFTGEVYPYPPGPATATGVLKTGDDCDEIDFKVEYNVVNTNEISFILEPGKDRNNNILTWWKKIAVPVVGGEIGIEIQDGYSASQKVPVSLIDKNRGIAFGKAKILGVHTGLAYTWNAWPAIIGGCRVTLVWRRDSCKQ